MRDLKNALRSLRRSPGFAVVAIGILGLAIGVNAGIFSVIDTVLLDPLPFEDADRLVYIAASAPGSDLPEEFGVATEFYVQYREQSELLEEVSTFNSFTSTLRTDDRVERIRMSAPTPTLFDTLGVGPMLGRLPVAADEDNVVVISHALWTSWFGGDEAVVGKSFYVSGKDRTVIGVMPKDFWFPNDGTLLWFPGVIRVEELQPGRFGRNLVARMAPGVEPAALATELDMLAKRLPERFGGSANYARLIEQHQPVIRSLEQELLGDIATPLWILLGSMAVVLLIACANVANLFMVRAERKQPDQAIRRALGADRSRLISSQMAEAAVVAMFSGLLAVLLAWAAVPLLVSAAPGNIPRLDGVSISPATLLFTFGACVIAALLCGLAPAVRFSSPNLMTMREGGRGSTGRRDLGRGLLVVAQTALALVLLIGSALLFQSFEKLRNVDPGYDTEDVFTFQIAPEGAHLEDAESYARFHLGFMDQLKALPGVQSVGIVENVPLNEGVASRRFVTEGSPREEDAGTIVSFTWAAGDYFGVMGIDVFQGRTFTLDDHLAHPGNVLISRSAADLLWPRQDPIGRRLQMQGEEAWETVVGVVDDVMQYGYRQAPEPMVYFPLIGQDPGNSRPLSSPAYVIKTPRASDIGTDVRALVKTAAPGAPMYRTYTMDGLAADSMSELSFTMMTIGIAALLALLLGVVGLYGVLSYAVAERTREIGLRMALGAEASRVSRMIVGQGARSLGAGIVLGALIAVLASRTLKSLLFEMQAFDLPTYIGISALTLAVGLVATYLPARRASKVDPMESLRE